MKKILFTRNLAVFGTLLVWIPILLPIVLSVIGLVSGKSFNFDFLMPAELFLVILPGAILLIVTSFLVKSNRTPILISSGITLLSLIAGPLIAVLTGLDSGETEPTSPAYLIVTAIFGVYNFSVIALGISGISLIRKIKLLPADENKSTTED